MQTFRISGGVSPKSSHGLVSFALEERGLVEDFLKQIWKGTLIWNFTRAVRPAGHRNICTYSKTYFARLYKSMQIVFCTSFAIKCENFKRCWQFSKRYATTAIWCRSFVVVFKWTMSLLEAWSKYSLCVPSTRIHRWHLLQSSQLQDEKCVSESSVRFM